jgi:hypothetical protein
MPVIKTKPSLNHKVIKNMTKQEVIDSHPDADEDHILSEWDKATGTTVDISEVVSDKDIAKAIKKIKE